MDPCYWWDEAAEFVLTTQLNLRKKAVHVQNFWGYVRRVKVKGVKSGDYTKSKGNKTYATDAFDLLQRSPNLTAKDLWDKVISNTEPKVHNSQMNVVAALFHEGYLIP
jgi:hypothetical protein